MRCAEEGLHIALGDLGEIGAALVGVQPSGRSDGAQEEHAQRPRARPGLQYAGSGKDVGLHQDLGCVLGVDHCRTSRHSHAELLHQGTKGQIRRAPYRTHHAALGLADEFVELDGALGGVEPSACGEDHRVPPSLGIAEGDAFTIAERPGAYPGEVISHGGIPTVLVVVPSRNCRRPSPSQGPTAGTDRFG